MVRVDCLVWRHLSSQAIVWSGSSSCQFDRLVGFRGRLVPKP
jgi:hypothetical protein